MKICGLCKIEKPLSDFSLKRAAKCGVQSNCKECRKAYQKQWYVQNKDLHIKRVRKASNATILKNKQNLIVFLKEKFCLDCGLNDIEVLEFDHLRDKEHNIAKMIGDGYSWSTILKEIKKCEVVCANCHRKRTYRRSGSYRLNTMHR